MRRNVALWFIKELTWHSVRILSDCVPDRLALARRFKETFGRPLNLQDPQTFNEKVFWLMLYYRAPLLTRLADKYEVRSYVEERIGASILTHLYGVWDRVEDIAFETLPDAFVLKVTWGSGMNIICHKQSDFDIPNANQRLRWWMKRNYYWTAREWAYKNIKPRIICEQLLTDRAGGTPPDYKFFCFGGEPRFVQVVTDRFTQYACEFFDLDWQRVPFTFVHPASGRAIPRPSNWEEMVACARILSKGLPFVRVDLYSIDGRTVFGEMTWYPYAGEGRFSPDSYDKYWGDALQLPL